MFNGKAIAEINQKIDHLLCHVHELKQQNQTIIRMLDDVNGDVIKTQTAKIRAVRQALIQAIRKDAEESIK